jgi:hypothetical protein
MVHLVSYRMREYPILGQALELPFLVVAILPCGVFPKEWWLCELSVAVDFSDNLWYFSEHHMRVQSKASHII